MRAPRKVIGVEQIDDIVITHTKRDLRPIVSHFIWAALMVITLLVAGSCDDNSGMYQGPNDDTPRYGGPK